MNEAAQPGKQGSLSFSDRKRVLVVDDDRILLDVLIAFFNRLAFEVSSAENGREALKMFQRDDFDIVVTDLNMPLMDGPALIQEIKVRSPETPVVVITGQDPAEVQRSPRMNIVSAVLHKPFGLDELSQTLEMVIMEENIR